MSRRVLLRPNRTAFEFDIYISPDGEEYNFFGTNTKWMMADSGHGMPPIAYFSTEGPLQHGETIYDYRLKPRTIRALVRQEACSRLLHWQQRATMMNLLRPNRQLANSFAMGTLRKVLSDGTTRDINCLIEEGPAFRLRNLEGWEENSIFETLDFRCPDPTFFDPTTLSLSFTLTASDELQFPIDFSSLAVPPRIVFGGSTLTTTENITYVGTWLSYPQIVITGPFNTPSIENGATNEKIELDYNVPVGRVVTMDLDYGDKTIEDDLGTNLLGTLTTDSNFATFHIAPDPEAPLGVNPITVSGAGLIPGTSDLTLSWLTRYIGF